MKFSNVIILSEKKKTLNIFKKNFSIIYLISCTVRFTVRQTILLCNVTRSTKSQSAQRSSELALRSTDFRSPENLIFPTLFSIVLDQIIKACVFFYQIFIFSPNDSSSTTIKNVFYFIEKALSVLEIFKFL